MRKLFYIIISVFVIGLIAGQYVLFKKLEYCEGNVYTLKQQAVENKNGIEVSKYVFENVIKELSNRIKAMQARPQNQTRGTADFAFNDLYYLEQRIEKLEKIIGVRQHEYYFKESLEERVDVIERELKVSR